MTPIFLGTVDSAGHLQVVEASQYDRWLKRLKGRDLEVIVRERPVRRTLNQNAYYHVIVKMIADETGDHSKSVHHDLKERFLPLGVTSTAGLTRRQFAAYLEYVIWFAERWLEMVIPPADRVLEAREEPVLVSQPRRRAKGAAA